MCESARAKNPLTLLLYLHILETYVILSIKQMITHYENAKNQEVD